MSSESSPCIDGPGTRGDVRAWSEDPLTARTRSIWAGADFLPIARSFEPGAAAFIARHETVRTAVRFALTPAVYGIELMLDH